MTYIHFYCFHTFFGRNRINNSPRGGVGGEPDSVMHFRRLPGAADGFCNRRSDFRSLLGYDDQIVLLPEQMVVVGVGNDLFTGPVFHAEADDIVFLF